MYIRRTLESTIKKAAQQFPAVVLTGPRQSGKTTLLKHLFSETHRYVSLELPDTRATALEDPRGFLAFYPSPVIMDEIQYAPELLPYIKEVIDQDRQKYGQFLLTGSSNILLMESVTESLAGRAAILQLLPLSFSEIADQADRVLPWEHYGPPTTDDLLGQQQMWPLFLRGNYPEPHANSDLDAELWHASYVQTYLERDVRSLRQVGDLSQFQSFLRALAARNAQLLNLSELARDLGIAVNTAKAWIGVLEATFQVMILRPYHANITKRLMKTPKIYFMDPGTLCHLTGLKDPDHARHGPLGGLLLETAVVTEVIKRQLHRGLEPRVYFWRTSAGSEVDLIVEYKGQLIPIEIKLSSTPRPRMAGSIHAFRKDMGKRAQPGYVVHTGREILPLPNAVKALPFREL